MGEGVGVNDTWDERISLNDVWNDVMNYVVKMMFKYGLKLKEIRMLTFWVHDGLVGVPIFLMMFLRLTNYI